MCRLPSTKTFDLLFYALDMCYLQTQDFKERLVASAFNVCDTKTWKKPITYFLTDTTALYLPNSRTGERTLSTASL